MSNKNRDWDALWSEFEKDMGKAPALTGRPLPKATRICRDFRVAVPMLCGTGTSVRFPRTKPVEAELTFSELKEKEEELEEMGSYWSDEIFQNLAPKYGEILRETGEAIPHPYGLIGARICKMWMPWLQKTKMFMASEVIEVMFDMIWCSRILPNDSSSFGSIFDRIVMAGGFPCGTESGQKFFKGIGDVPPLVVFWPWTDKPTFE